TWKSPVATPASSVEPTQEKSSSRLTSSNRSTASPRSARHAVEATITEPAVRPWAQSGDRMEPKPGYSGGREADPLMAAVAERLVPRCTAATEGDARVLPDDLAGGAD